MTELPFLLRLIDDPSPRVREKVAQRLRLLSDEHEEFAEAVRELLPTLTPEQQRLLQAALPAPNGGTLPDSWLSWLELPTEADKLEAAWSLLARWQLDNSEFETPSLSSVLDEIARHYQDTFGVAVPEAQALSHYLFQDLGLEGADAGDYYNPLNSNLLYALQEKRGLPITLAGLYILVGTRLGMDVGGCNFPNRFLVMVREDGRELLLDPFGGGQIFSDEEAEVLRHAVPEAMQFAPAETIITRVLRNLTVAYQRAGDVANARFILDLMARLEGALHD